MPATPTGSGPGPPSVRVIFDPETAGGIRGLRSSHQRQTAAPASSPARPSRTETVSNSTLARLSVRGPRDRCHTSTMVEAIATIRVEPYAIRKPSRKATAARRLSQRASDPSR